MKRWILCAVALILAASLEGLPFHATDVGKLQPVELVWVGRTGEGVEIRTDTGDLGTGPTVSDAFADLKRTCPGEVFLDTAEYLILTPDSGELLGELSEFLRPACRLCIGMENRDLEQATRFLSAHKPELTLQDYGAGDRNIPILREKEGKFHLEQSGNT